VSERALLAEWRDALRDSGLDTKAKAVGFVIATYWDRNGHGAFPSKQTIAAGASLPKRTADLAIDRLERGGFLAVARSRGRRANVYSATVPTVQQAAGLTVQLAAGLSESNHAATDAQPCSSEHPTMQLAAPESGKAKAKPLNASRAGARGQRQVRARRDYSEYDR
jgi:hypothetical protein